MDQPTGGKIALRQLGPLPDLDSVVFVRKQNRAFVTGQGPLATSASKTVRRFLRAGTWLFLIAGVVITLVVGAMEYSERQQRAALEASVKTVDAQVVGCENRATSSRSSATPSTARSSTITRARPAPTCATSAAGR
jgi:hypothetical protein